MYPNKRAVKFLRKKTVFNITLLRQNKHFFIIYIKYRIIKQGLIKRPAREKKISERSLISSEQGVLKI